MRIPMRVDYGVRALVDLALQVQGGRPVRTAEIAENAGVPCVSAWTAMRDALASLGVKKLALGTPYPRGLHDLARPFFERNGYGLSDDATLDELQEVVDFMHTVRIEDIPICESVQRGLNSRGYDQGRFMVDKDRSDESEHAVHHFQSLVQDALGH